MAKSNLRCKCGKPAFAKGKCRVCYDRDRSISNVAISKEIQDQFNALHKKMGWSFSFTANFLMKKGLKFIQKQKELKEQWEID